MYQISKKELIGMYPLGLIQFTKDVKVENNENERALYRADSARHITPTILYLIYTGQIPDDAYVVVLRQVQQLEAKEIVKLSEIIVPREKDATVFIRQVKKNNIDKRWEVAISLTDKIYIPFNLHSAAHIHQVLHYNESPIAYDIPLGNQNLLIAWMLKKHIDIFNIQDEKIVKHRLKWSTADYETFATVKKHYNI